ncbi:MAG TPA: hypothetical protein DIU15_02795 [Deltaproteobacteria bacterium]|nr:hypothetical protein [Deltaproteobacteria bacterium]HCP44943.1 hypothetical protein [Deltaproteobacteria bacterium]
MSRQHTPIGWFPPRTNTSFAALLWIVLILAGCSAHEETCSRDEDCREDSVCNLERNICVAVEAPDDDTEGAGEPIPGDDDDSAESDDDDSAGSGEILPEEQGSLKTTNSVGRSGSYFLPARAAGEPLALLAGYHATGGAGSGFLSTFVDLARTHGFAIVAPDSRISPDGQYTWEVGNLANEVTPDYSHMLACIDELTARPDATLGDGRILAAGHSGGASSAPYIATNEDRFQAFAVLHGGVIAGGIGEHLIPGWFSTGENDTIRSPEHLQEQMDYMTALGFSDLELHIYPGGHGISDQEASEMVAWWLAL